MTLNNQSFDPPEICNRLAVPAHQAPSDIEPPWPGFLNRLPGYGDLHANYTRAAATLAGGACPYTHYLHQLKVRVDVSEIDLRRLPRQGPLLVIANHPFGGLDGLMLGSILARVRPDVKLLGNHFLSRIDGMDDAIIPVDVLGGRAATGANSGALRKAVAWLRSGGCLGVFPAGEVSRFRWKELNVTDREWQRHVGAIVRLSQATVVPVYFPGRNSALFTMASLLHPFLGTALLPLELARRKGQSFRAVIGEARTASRLPSMGDDQALMNHLQRQTYFLSHRMATRGLARIPIPKKPRQSPALKKIIAPIPQKRLENEIQSLPPDQQLARQGRFGVYYAEAIQAPHLVNEIGRLRETTFREVGEGTGQPVDLDRFDPHYLHLFLWNHEHGELAGAYRLGLTDRLLQTCGLAGLYTTTLFRFKPELLQELTPAVELGRAFVRSAYQRHHACLFLLWRGIGQFIVRHPQYHKLFGPVSISQDYQKLSRDLMIRYLRANKMDQRLARLVTPRQPVRIRSRRILKDPTIDNRCHNPEDIAILVSELEEDGKGLPVLLRQYLKLDATLLSFNLDKAFSNVVDGLVFLDLTRTASPMVKRVMGKEGYRQFCAFHRLGQGDRFRQAS